MSTVTEAKSNADFEANEPYHYLIEPQVAFVANSHAFTGTTSLASTHAIIVVLLLSVQIHQ